MLRRFWEYARPYRRRYLVGLILLLATNGLILLLPWLLRGAVDAMERRAPLQTVGGFAAGMIGVALLQALTRTGSRLMILGNSRRIVFDIRNRFFSQLQRLDAKFFDTNRTGDIMSRGVNDLVLLRSFYGPGVLNLLNTSLLYVGALVLLLRIDLMLTFMALLPYPILFLGVSQLSRRVYARSNAVQEQLGVLSSRVQENLSGINQVKTYAQEDREIGAFRELCAEYRRRNLSMATIRGAMMALIGGITGLGGLIVLLVGGRHVIDGRISFADFVAFNGYLALLAWPTIAMGWIVNVFQRGVGAMGRVSEILDRAPRIPPPGDEAAPAPPIAGDLEIRNLTFAYGDDGGEPQLRDISVRIPRGSRVALVGEVGSGKSTLVNLLARVYPCPPGTIFVDGIDLTEIPVQQMRGSLGYVPQEAFLFSRSLRENITLASPDATDEEIDRALGVAHLRGDLPALPDGLETILGERGFTLSGGQRQRATLARAAMGDPRILILDDSLSSVDADTERAILGELEQLMQGRTFLLITHRPSTLAGVDRILVLDGGRIVEDGSHEVLLAKAGVYARLFHRTLLEARLETR